MLRVDKEVIPKSLPCSIAKERMTHRKAEMLIWAFFYFD